MAQEHEVPVWEGNWGTYVIPAGLRDVRVRKDGWVDMRQKRAYELIRWAAEQEKASRIQCCMPGWLGCD